MEFFDYNRKTSKISKFLDYNRKTIFMAETYSHIMAGHIFKRELYLSRIRPFIDNEQVKVLTGIRRCGKTMVLHMIRDELISLGRDQDNILFEDMESNVGRNYRDGGDLYDKVLSWSREHEGRTYLLLDEIQSLEGWEMCIRSLKTDLDIDIYLTGSSSKMLSGELATHLAGRYVEFRIHPFSFREVCDIHQDVSKSILFGKYLVHGGMPLIVMNGYDPLMNDTLLKAMYDSVVIRDICERNNIRNTHGLRTILMYAMSEIGHTMSSTNISNYLRNQRSPLTHDTILEYLSVAGDAMFLSKVQRQDLRGKNLLKTDYKFYLEDHGFRESCGLNNMSSIDQVLENIVYNELVRRGYIVTIGKGDGSEIDFVADKGSSREYYQVTYLMASEDTKEREFGALRRVHDNHPKYVLSMDTFDFGTDGLIHRNIMDWLSDI